MPREYKKLVASNAMLNKAGHHSIAAICANMKIEQWHGGAMDGELTISDCSDNIHINFEYNNEDERKNALHKIKTIIKHAQLIQTCIEEYSMKRIKEINKENK